MALAAAILFTDQIADYFTPYFGAFRSGAINETRV